MGDTYNVIRAILGYCNLSTVARICLLDKSCQQLANTAKTGKWLPGAVKSATYLGGASHLKAVSWVLRKGGGAVPDQTAAAALVEIPGVPVEVASELVQSGLRITYEQLVAAARKGVVGSAVWVTAQRGLGIAGGLCPLVRYLATTCYEVYEESLLAELLQLQLQPGQFPDILALAATAHMDETISADAAKALLHAAGSLQGAALLQQLTPSFVSQLLLAAAGLARWTVVHELCSPAVVALVTAETAAGVLTAAVQQGNLKAIQQNFKTLWPVLKVLGAEPVCGLLQLAVAPSCSWGKDVTNIIAQLFRLPGAKQLTSNQLASIMQTAVTGEDAAAAYVLQHAPAAAFQQLPQEVAQLLEAAVQCSMVRTAGYLCGHHSAPVDAGLVQRLLQLVIHGVPMGEDAAFGTGAPQWVAAEHTVQQLCQLPAANQLDAAAVAGLLRLAIARFGPYSRPMCMVWALRRLPGAMHIDGAVMEELMGLAVPVRRGTQLLKALCSLAAAQSVGAQLWRVY